MIIINLLCGKNNIYLWSLKTIQLLKSEYYLNEENLTIVSLKCLTFNGFNVFSQNNPCNHKRYRHITHPFIV